MLKIKYVFGLKRLYKVMDNKLILKSLKQQQILFINSRSYKKAAEDLTMS
jgi:hypothetical protein